MTTKCFGCFVDAKFILPCYHGLCKTCLDDVLTSEELVCHCYPEDGDVQCSSRFEKEDVRDLSVHIELTKCIEHNEEITGICDCKYLYCDKCVISCNKCFEPTGIEDWKTHILESMDDAKSELDNKITGFKCMTDMIQKYKYKEIESVIKQFEIISDTLLVDIQHIEHFVQFVNDLPISQIIKTAKKILTNDTINIPADILDPIKNKNTDLDNAIKIMEIIIFTHNGNIHGYHDQALVYASDKGNLDVVELLLNYDADVNACDDSALRWASSNGHMAVVELLIKHGANIDAKNTDALRMASQYGHLPAVECLIKNGADVNAYYNSSLIGASENRHVAVMECLISHGADVHYEEDFIIIKASMNGHLDVVECLVSHGADIHSRNDQSLTNASENGHLTVVECLIKYGANIHAQNENALIWASNNGHLDVVKCLVNHGANIHASNDQALIFASCNRYFDVVEYLKEHASATSSN